MELRESQFSVVHKPDRLHNNADALSRLSAPPKDALVDPERAKIDSGDEDPVHEHDNCAITVNPRGPTYF